MYGRVRIGARFFAIALLAPLAAACTTTAPVATSPGIKTDSPVSGASSSFSNFIPAPVRSVDYALAQPCITAAANKYFLPERVISATGTRPGANGGTDVDLKVDLRTAVCSLTANGGVRSVVDTSPKSADQAAAEAAAARATPVAASAPKKVRAKKK